MGGPLRCLVAVSSMQGRGRCLSQRRWVSVSLYWEAGAQGSRGAAAIPPQQ